MNICQFYHKKRVLVTGSTGHLATNLVLALKDIDCDIIRLSRPSAVFTPVEGQAHIENVTGNLCDRDLWERVLPNIDVVFHFAAQTSYIGNDNPPVDLDINFAPMMQLLESCRRHRWHPTVLFSGTVTETGIPTHLPVDETHPDRPITVYDLHKLMAERYLEYYVRQRFVRGATLRLANVYGPGPRNSSTDRGMLNIMVHRAIRGEPLTIYGDGAYVRDYIYIEDVVHAFLAAGAHIDRVNGQHYVVGSEHGYTIAEAIQLVAQRAVLKTGRHTPVLHIDPPAPLLPIEVRNFVASTTRFAQATGWRAYVPLAEGIDRTLEFFLNEGAYTERVVHVA